MPTPSSHATDSPAPVDVSDQPVNAPEHASSRVDITEKPALAAGSGPAFLALLLILALTAGSITLLNVGGVAADAGEPGAVLRIAAGQMQRDGHLFYQSDNGVWLTDHVPLAYIRFDA